jgi:hypothetical protein
MSDDRSSNIFFKVFGLKRTLSVSKLLQNLLVQPIVLNPRPMLKFNVLTPRLMLIKVLLDWGEKVPGINLATTA